MRGSRRKELGDLDSDSEFGSEARMDGINALVFRQSLGSPLIGAGYVPHHKEPPRYIRTRASNKKTREFTRLFLAQELVGTRPPEDDGGGDATADAGKGPEVAVSVAGAGDRKTTRTGGAIWATEFSKDGKYLASAGRDHVVRVWAVISTPEERRAHEEDEAANGGAGERLSAPVFREQPIREFRGHAGEVLDLSWSKNNFLLSSSMDKTVRLWHMSRPECLCTFKHKDFVTRLAFHPRDDRFFLAGSLDTMLRLWSIPDKSVAFSAQLPDLVTAVAFSPDGKVAIAGLLNGLCMFYETEGLKLSAQIHVRSSRGKNAKGSKITGIQTMCFPPPSPVEIPPSQAPRCGASAPPTSTDRADSGEVRVLVTSNDSRVRIYSLRDKSLVVKLKGHVNSCSQIAASFSDDGKYVICGSEDRKAFVWSLRSSDALDPDKDKSPCEYFEAHGEIVTTALLAPTKTRMLLGQSGDPIYDLCNPPPVVLRGLGGTASAAASEVALSANDAHNAAAPEPPPKRPEPSPGYIARSTHYDGNILVTTGETGIIKVFRQDCAFAKRRTDSWETGSTFSRKLAASGGGHAGARLRRSLSILTRSSAGSTTTHSRRGSISQSMVPGSIGSPQLGVGGGRSERILSWRQGIQHGVDRRPGVAANGGATPRSVSPAMASRTSLHSIPSNSAGDSRKQQSRVGSPPARNRAGSTLTTASVFSSPGREGPSFPPTPSFTFHAADADDQARPGAGAPGGGSSFWNVGRWRGISGLRASSSSPGQGATAGPRRRSTSSRGSLSAARRRDETDGSGDEDGTATARQQSPGGVFPGRVNSEGSSAFRRVWSRDHSGRGRRSSSEVNGGSVGGGGGGA